MSGAGLLIFSISLWFNGISWGYVAGKDTKLVHAPRFAPFQIATLLGMFGGGIAMGYSL